MGGGGSSGKVSHTDWWESYNQFLIGGASPGSSIGTNMFESIKDAVAAAGNPYNTSFVGTYVRDAYDPDALASEINSDADAFETFAEGIDPVSSYADFVFEAAGEADAYLWPNSMESNVTAWNGYLTQILGDFDTAMYNSTDILAQTAIDGDAYIAIFGDVKTQVDTYLYETNFVTSSSGWGAIATEVDAKYNPEDLWEDYADTVANKLESVVRDATVIIDSATQFNAQVDADIEDNILPRFQAGMRDINAVNSSAFIIGEAIIEARALDDKTKYLADLNFKQHDKKNEMLASELKNVATMHEVNVRTSLDIMKMKLENKLNRDKSIVATADSMSKASMDRYDNKSKLMVAETRSAINTYANEVGARAQIVANMTKDVVALKQLSVQAYKDAVQFLIETRRINYLMKYEEDQSQIEIDDSWGRWEMDIFMMGANAMASHGGGVSQGAGSKKASKTTSAVSGGLSGAATGAYIGASYGSGYPVVGTAIGAVVGAVAGYLSAS